MFSSYQLAYMQSEEGNC